MSSSNPKIDILLAVCNGEKYLEEQINSLLQQTYSNIHVIIRDDLSNDSSQAIIETYQKQYPSKIEVIQGKERVGVKENFSQLMNASNAPYIMFCDQDDVWFPHKVMDTIETMLYLEKNYGEQPYLVHANLNVVDEKLNLIHESFWDYVKIYPLKSKGFNKLLNQNVVTGCTVMINRLLLEVAKPIPKQCFMHDWWLALTAAAFGKIEVIDRTLIYYRQHSNNSLGAQKFAKWSKLKIQFQKLMNRDVRKFEQASIFYHRYNELFDTKQREVLKTFLKLNRQSWLKKRWMIYRQGFYKQGFLRNLADFILG